MEPGKRRYEIFLSSSTGPIDVHLIENPEDYAMDDLPDLSSEVNCVESEMDHQNSGPDTIESTLRSVPALAEIVATRASSPVPMEPSCAKSLHLPHTHRDAQLTHVSSHHRDADGDVLLRQFEAPPLSPYMFSLGENEGISDLYGATLVRSQEI